jgi:uncharacterized phage protein gp47/JayE
MHDREDKVARRTMLAGAGTVGALAAAATLMPGREQHVAAPKEAERTAADDSSAGYRLTEHVKQYYRTTRV